MQKRLTVTVITLILLLVGTMALVLYGRGYRLTFDRERITLAGTGLLVATSKPDGASLFLNGRLTSATNTTLNLPPGTYEVRIVKDGYLPWEKRLTVAEEVVTKVEASLWPKAPKLESLTAIGAKSPTVDPTATRISFQVSSSTPKKNGIYVLDMAGRPILTLQNAASVIADDTKASFSQGKLSWSPSGRELIATASAETFMLSPDRFNQTPQNVSSQLSVLETQWKKEKEEKERARLASLPEELATLIQKHFSNPRFSPDDTKVFYIASNSATLAPIITPPLPGSNTQAEERSIKPGRLYVYDIKEDKNFLIAQAQDLLSQLSFMPDSQHLVFIENQKIQIVEYDGMNKTTVYAGPFERTFVTPWPDGSKLVILTNLGADNLEANLYTISLR